MSLEHGFSPDWASFKADAAPSSTLSAVEVKESREFGLSDIILPDDEVANAELHLREMGLRVASDRPTSREVLNPEGTAWKPGEFVLTLTEVSDGKPLGEARLTQVVQALREGPEQLRIRLAKSRQR